VSSSAEELKVFLVRLKSILRVVAKITLTMNNNRRLKTNFTGLDSLVLNRVFNLGLINEKRP
jgi:hypothetical protein